MRVETAFLLGAALMIAGCDRQSQPPAQGDGVTDSASNDAAGTSAATPSGKLDRSHSGEAMPATGFKAPDGSATTLAALRGKPVLVNLWATWCAPCIKEMPTLEALAKREGDALHVVAISQDITGPEKVTAYFDEAGFTALRPYLDDQAGLSVAYAANLPTTVLYDAQGQEVWRYTGALDWTGAEAAALIAEADAG